MAKPLQTTIQIPTDSHRAMVKLAKRRKKANGTPHKITYAKVISDGLKAQGEGIDK